MKTLSIDIETYSSVAPAKCGVYKYTEATDFNILLFGIPQTAVRYRWSILSVVKRSRWRSSLH